MRKNLTFAGANLKSDKVWLLTQLQGWIYPIFLSIVLIVWLGFMTIQNCWYLLGDFWPISVTMALGSFVAGSTPQGGATVAFPVFTKLLQIPVGEARTFGLMIQSIGMGAAAALIFSRRIKILPNVVGWVSLGRVRCMVLGVYLIQAPPPFRKVLFTFIASAFAGAMVFSRWGMKWSPRETIMDWNYFHRAVFIAVGLFGGALAANTGSGTDMLTFMVLTLAFGINEKISTPTSVVIMAVNSFVGFFIYAAIRQDVGIVWNYWLVAVPVVAIGAPLGAYVASIIKRDYLILFILCLIMVELATTLWLIPLTPLMVLIVVVGVFVCIIWFAAMLYYRQKYVAQKIVPVSNN